uniref:Plasmodium RESA N-terminal domain-containing protein n=1 Tax=Mimivirus LCMiAC01 TaxID=2506608 RepID=A0A481Z1B5_9VIRU|nr:MAG: hypothetical protein LCMiAC01_05690 [Mimivirus LCMiAC01]
MFGGKISENKKFKRKYKKYKNKYMSLKLSRALNYMRNSNSLAREQPTDENETKKISKIKAEWNRFIKNIHDNTTAFPQDLVDIILTLTLQWDGYVANTGSKVNIDDFINLINYFAEKIIDKKFNYDDEKFQQLYKKSMIQKAHKKYNLGIQLMDKKVRDKYQKEVYDELNKQIMKYYKKKSMKKKEFLNHLNKVILIISYRIIDAW